MIMLKIIYDEEFICLYGGIGLRRVGAVLRK